MKNRRQISLRARKKINKEIHRGLKGGDTPDKTLLSDELTPKKILARYPKKVAKKEQAILQGALKSLETKAKKRVAKHAKRTTPGTVDNQSSPKNPHVEGKHWLQAIEKQVLNQNLRLSKKLSKRKKR